MSGVAIRSYELSRALLDVADVTLAGVKGRGEALSNVPPGLLLTTYEHERPGALRSLVEAADVIVSQPQPPAVMRWLARSRARLIFDLYDPEVFENLAIFEQSSSRFDQLWLSLTVDRLISALHIGHHFICANEAQRDLWIGAMVAERVIRPSRYAADPSFRSVIATVPFGVSKQAPERTPGEGLRSRFPTIGAHDRVLLWNGGLWSWLEPQLVVRAVAELAARDPRVRLVFMGSGQQTTASVAGETRELAVQFELLDSVVFMNDAWVPYEQRGSWLLEAECAVAAQSDHLETRYAFRTRLLDCFWAGLPIVTTRGDDLAGRVERDGLGAAVAVGDVAGFAAAIEHVLARGRGAYATALARTAEEYRWDRVAAPLRAFVLGQHHVPRLSKAHRTLASRPTQRLRSVAHQVARRTLAIRRGT